MPPSSMPPPAVRRRGSGVKLVYDTLRDEILGLVHAPGSPIDEVHLAERFHMSRTPIREALVRLSGEGLVHTLPNRSTLVAPIDFLNMSAFFDALVLMHRVTSRLAAEHRRPRDLKTIRARQAAFAEAVADQNALAMIATNAAFHVAIAEAGRNPYFTGLFSRLMDEGRRSLRMYYDSYDDQLPQRFVDEHDMMIAAIEAGDKDRADALARHHAEQIVEQLKSLFAREARLDVAL